jgi:putative membrane protein
MMNGWDGGMGVAGWTLMTIFWIALVVLIGLAIVKLFPSKPDGGSADGGTERPGPQRLLDERLARGDIDVETYERLRETLAGRGSGR